MNVRLLLLLIGIFKCTWTDNNIRNKTFEIEIASQPGIVFERQHDIKFIRGLWKIVISIDLKVFNEELVKYKEKFNQIIINTARFREDYSKHITKINKIRKILNNSWELYKIKRNLCANITSQISDSELTNYNIEVSKLSTFQDEIMNYINKKMIIMNSSLNKIEPESINAIKLLPQLFRELEENSKMPVSFMPKDRYEILLAEIIKLVKRELHISNQRSSLVLQAIRAIQRKQIMPFLLSQEDLSRLMGIIENILHLKFPTSTRMDSMQKFEKFCEIRYGIWKEKFFIELQTPLVNKEVSTLYKMQSVFVPQNLFNRTVYASIKPRSNYLLTRERAYYHFQINELINCKIVEDFYLCPSEWFVFKINYDCESTLLFQPKKIDFERCNIEITMDFEEYFIRSYIGDSWFYSLNETTQIEQICENYMNSIYQLKNSGILKYYTSCSIRYKNQILTLDSYFYKKESPFIVPPIDLALHKISKFKENCKERDFFYELRENNIHNFWQLKCFNNNDEYQDLMISVIILSIVITFLFAVTGGILSFLYYFKRVLEHTPNEVELQICERGNSDANVTARRGVLRFR